MTRSVIGIAGSPRKNGNSTTLMRAVLRGASGSGVVTSEVALNELCYRGCQGCERCIAGNCIVEDDLTPVLHSMAEASGWVLASPVYYDGISGQLKTFFDRCRTFTRNPDSQKTEPQLKGDRRAVIILTYEDAKERPDYLTQAEVLAKYLRWMGNFSRVKIVCEGELGPASAAQERTDLLERAESIGKSIFG